MAEMAEDEKPVWKSERVTNRPTDWPADQPTDQSTDRLCVKDMNSIKTFRAESKLIPVSEWIRQKRDIESVAEGKRREFGRKFIHWIYKFFSMNREWMEKDRKEKAFRCQVTNLWKLDSEQGSGEKIYGYSEPKKKAKRKKNEIK